jgi:hypothetical protein
MRKCSDHLGKAIFKAEYMAHNYMAAFHPEKHYQVYPCPDSKDKHFHIRDSTKRNRRHKDEDL